MSEFVTRQYSDRAQDYVQSATHAQGEDLDRLKMLLESEAPFCALDLGCGGGHVSYALAACATQVVACDPTRTMAIAVKTEAATRSLASIRPVCGFAEALPFADHAFDAVVSRYSAHHWGDLACGLAEARRVLRPQGVGVFIDTVAPPGAMEDSVLQAIETLRDPSHMRNYRVDEWRLALAKAGFTVEAQEAFRLRLDFRSWVARTRTPDLHRQAILSLQQATSPSVREVFEIAEDGSFTIDTAFFVVR
ncbi:SAM-dependent methyltransferase [Asaia sp. W19]|uniref:class I SAM-dependent methyltransferase n=1 Tax=unclassified Asaia TaxID=2685023 RepID=UPI000F8E9320|nr:class I SAM-dependent methyltransferase [Asaia sp. W19]RUT25032.1 SAM-dependent methyltransferase [Asaia sp. W19]